MNEKLETLIQEARKARAAYLAQQKLLFSGPNGSYNGRYGPKQKRLYDALMKIEKQILKEIYA